MDRCGICITMDDNSYLTKYTEIGPLGDGASQSADFMKTVKVCIFRP